MPQVVGSISRSEPRFRDLAESLPHMVWTCQGDGPCDYLSPQWIAYTGIPEDQQLGYRWLEQLHPDDVELAQARWAAATESGRAFDTEFRIRRHDGVYRWFKTRAVPSLDRTGRVVKWFGTNTDIQDLKDAQDATARLNRELEARVAARTDELRAANGRLQTLAAQLQTAQRITKVGSWEYEVATDAVQWSDELFRIFGVDPREKTPRYRDTAKMLEPDSWSRLDAAVRHSRATGQGYELVLTAIRSDGERRTTIARAECIRDASGNVTHIVGTFQDITARERVAAELKRVSDRLQLATSSARIGVWEWDIATNALVWDETMLKLYELDDVASRLDYVSWRRLVHPEDLVRLDDDLRAAFEGTKDLDLTFRIFCPTGRMKYLRAAAAVERDEKGRPLRLTGVNWDITEQRTAEQALLQSNALQRAILAHAGPAVIGTAPDGTINLFNRAAEELLGYAAQEVVGTATPVLIHDHAEIDAQRVAVERELGVATTSDFDVFVARSRVRGADVNEWTYVRKDGSRVPVLLTVTTVRDDAETIVGYLGVAVNLTHRKAQERELLELNRLLAERSAQREVLLQEIHHRVKNNLQVIASLVNMQARQVADVATHDALVECRTRILAMALIHEQLYQSSDYSRIPFSDYTQQLARNVFAASGVGPERVPLTLDVERVSLPVEKAIPCGLILNELITNAVKHAFPDDRRGTVEIALHRTSDGELRLSVADDGIGLGRGFALEHNGSLGMQLISDLATQIDARIAIATGNGTRVEVIVPHGPGESNA